MLSRTSSSAFLITRASSITCWPSRTSMPSFCSAKRKGGSTRSMPSGMPATPSRARMPRRRAEIPQPGLAVAGEEAPAGELVARPLADHGAGDVADIVLVEQEQGAQPRPGEGPAGAAEAVLVQAAEVHPLLEIHLGVAGRLDRPVPAVLRIDRVGLPGPGLRGRGRCPLARQLRLLAFVVDDASLLPQTCRSR